MAKSDVERLAKLSRDRDSFLSVHKTLMETYKKTKVSRYKDMASVAQYEAKKRSDRIADIIKENNDDDDPDAD